MSVRVRQRWRGVSIPKDGNTADECEDAYGAHPSAGRYAIADGATSSIYSGLWARILVDAFLTAADNALAEDEWIEPCRAKWSAKVDSLEVPWYMAEKRQLGAFSTFLGVRQKPDGWELFVCGDSCLLQVREGKLVRALPLTSPGDFGNHPDLIPSRHIVHVALKHTALSDEPGDELFLVTDALAEWSLRRAEEGEPIWKDLEAIRAAEDSARLLASKVASWRQAGMRNDDVTLLAIVL